MTHPTRITLLAALLALLLLPRPAPAAWPILSEKDLQKFVHSFPAMYAESRHLGLWVNPELGRVEGVERVKKDKQVEAILARNGWGWGFWPSRRRSSRRPIPERRPTSRRKASAGGSRSTPRTWP